ncbi:hypothetical protein E2C01_013431 [Portunus trituberculatus]|uniref:Uncharacterized protein n=1 Tax=Portunus trituberculatus TaxID=210409 RepID=A0A5B7DH95_PORTR|nr:hypothetical protein [Portunus trituberculatus]
MWRSSWRQSSLPVCCCLTLVCQGTLYPAKDEVHPMSGNEKAINLLAWQAPTTCPNMTTATTYLDSSNILQLGNFTQLMVEGVDNQPGIHISKDEENPQQAHEDMVGEDHIIDNRCIDDDNDQRAPLHIGDESIRKNGDGQASPSFECAREGSHRADGSGMRYS